MTVLDINKLNGNKVARKSTFQKVLLLLLPGEGQKFGGRTDLHLACACRDISDPQIWTHLCLFIASLFALYFQLYDLFTLLTLTTPLSTIYHFQFERPGFIARAEGILAKIMFVYGIIQLFYAPNFEILLGELLCLVLTLTVFIGTNIDKRYYEPWHSLMHVVPAAWGIIIACNHAPLII
jgi:hypothetical protein